MKKTTTLTILLMMASLCFSQSFKDKMASKIGGGSKGGSAKAVEAPEGEYSDPTGLSGTYFATTDMPYGDTKKMIKVAKLEYVADKNKVILHCKKGEEDPTAFWMEDYMKWARDNIGLSQFRVQGFSIFTVEPGVVVYGYSTRAPKDYPGYHEQLIIADEAKVAPVILVKDESQVEKYTYEDAKRIFSERATAAEIANLMRIGEKTPMPRIGTMTSDKTLVERSVQLMKEKWADSKEPERFVGAYIYNNDWAEVQYGKILDPHKTTFSDEVTAIMMFKNSELNLYYYYSMGISRKRTDISAEGIDKERGLAVTGNSTIQYITEAKVKEVLGQIGQ